jgi:phage shock protein A
MRRSSAIGIFRRTTDVITANVNDLVDYFEEPERLLRQAMRDIEASLATTRAAVARSIGGEKLLVKARADHLVEIEAWRRRAANALAEGDEALARAAVARQIDRQQALDAVDTQLAEAHEANGALRRQLNLLVERHATAQSQLILLTAQQSAATAQREALAALAIPTNPSDAWARFQRFHRQIELAQAQSLAELELLGGAAWSLVENARTGGGRFVGQKSIQIVG